MVPMIQTVCLCFITTCSRAIVLLLGAVLGFLSADTLHSLFIASIAESRMRAEGLHFLGDRYELHAWRGLGDRQQSTGELGGLSRFLGRRIGLGRLVALPWEDDQLRSVLLEALYICLQRLHGAVVPPMVYCNTNCAGQLRADTSRLHQHNKRMISQTCQSLCER